MNVHVNIISVLRRHPHVYYTLCGRFKVARDDIIFVATMNSVYNNACAGIDISDTLSLNEYAIRICYTYLHVARAKSQFAVLDLIVVVLYDFLGKQWKFRIFYAY